MSEIAKCPVCGETPMELVASFGKSFVAIACCGAEFRKKELWNQYAAAMELARATAEYGNELGFDEIRIDNGGDDPVVGRINDAAMRVLEVFK